MPARKIPGFDTPPPTEVHVPDITSDSGTIVGMDRIEIEVKLLEPSL